MYAILGNPLFVHFLSSQYSASQFRCIPFCCKQPALKPLQSDTSINVILFLTKQHTSASLLPFINCYASNSNYMKLDFQQMPPYSIFNEILQCLAYG